MIAIALVVAIANSVVLLALALMRSGRPRVGSIGPGWEADPTHGTTNPLTARLRVRGNAMEDNR